MYRICLIWGTSAFWQFWKRYFESRGFPVTVTSRSTEISPERAVQEADIIIFSVSIRSTNHVIETLVPQIPPWKLVLDFTGIKKEASERLKLYTSGEVVATHPMFGPWVKSLRDQNIAYDPIAPWEKWHVLFDLWKSDGANMIELSSDHHDELVAIVQSSVHILNLILGHLLKKRGINVGELLSIATPNSRMQLCILGRFLNQNAGLYTDMQVYNSVYRDEILPEILHYLEEVTDTIKSHDTNLFEAEFEAIRRTLGSWFLHAALEISESFDSTIQEYFKSKKNTTPWDMWKKDVWEKW